LPIFNHIKQQSLKKTDSNKNKSLVKGLTRRSQKMTASAKKDRNTTGSHYFLPAFFCCSSCTRCLVKKERDVSWRKCKGKFAGCGFF
jgi:hypothetical protein